MQSQPTDLKKEAAELINKGNSKFRTGEMKKALALYDAAYRVFPSPKLFYNLGETHLALGNTVEAANLFERFLTESELDRRTPLRQAAERRRLELSKTLAAMTIRSSDADAEFSVDDQVLGRLPVDRFFYLSPGVYTLNVTKPGFVPHTQKIELRAGDWQSFEVTLVAQGLPRVPTVKPPVREAPLSPSADLFAQTSARASSDDEDEGVTDKWWFWVAVIGGVGLAAGATALIVDGVQFESGNGTLGSTSTDEWEQR